MSLDNALRYALRNYSTLFLLVAIITVPLHLAYTFAYKDVVAVGDLHHFIAELPQGRKVAGVGRGRLAESRTAGLGLTAVELILVPFVAAAAARTVEVDAAGGLPGVMDSLSHAWPWRKETRLSRGQAEPDPGRPAGAGGVPIAALATAVVLGFAAGWLLQRIGLVLSELLAREQMWVGVGLAQGVARAVGAPLALAPLALRPRSVIT